MMNLNQLRKKSTLQRIKILRKENLKIMKVFMMMKIIMMVMTLSGWIIHGFN